MFFSSFCVKWTKGLLVLGSRGRYEGTKVQRQWTVRILPSTGMSQYLSVQTITTLRKRNCTIDPPGVLTTSPTSMYVKQTFGTVLCRYLVSDAQSLSRPFPNRSEFVSVLVHPSMIYKTHHSYLQRKLLAAQRGLRHYQNFSHVQERVSSVFRSTFPRYLCYAFPLFDSAMRRYAGSSLQIRRWSWDNMQYPAPRKSHGTLIGSLITKHILNV